MSLVNDKISVLIIDTSVHCRELLSEVIQASSDMQLLATSPNGNIGMIKLLDLKPDVVLLDVTIQDYNLEDFTKEALKALDHCGIILTSKKSTKDEKLNEAILALEYGAFDLFEKPAEVCKNEFDYIQRRLLIKIREYSIKKYSKIAKEASSQITNKNEIEQQVSKYTNKNESRFKIITIGVSTGGPKALSAIIPQLPANFPVPVLIVIHLPELFSASMAKELNKKSQLNVKEAKDGDIVTKGNVYIAKGGMHMSIAKSDNNDFKIIYDDNPPENNCKPAVDVLFRSAAENFGANAIGIILTGMGSDGAKGMQLMKEKNAVTIAQDKNTSVVWGMPGSAVQLNCVDKILPLEKIMFEVMEII